MEAAAEPTLAQLQAQHTIPPRPGTADIEHGETAPWRNYVRDLVLGFNDGVVSVYALVAGIAGAGFTPHQIGLAGIAAALAGALSMGLGEYISTKSQAQYYRSEARREREHIRAYPHLEKAELLEMLEAKKYPPHLVEQLAQHIGSSEDRFVDFMMREEFGVGKESDRSPFAAMGLVMGAFLVGAALPVVPFLLLGWHPLAIATGASLLGLFAAGFVKGLLSGLPGLRSGLEMALLGSLAAAVTYFVGRWVGLAAA